MNKFTPMHWKSNVSESGLIVIKGVVNPGEWQRIAVIDQVAQESVSKEMLQANLALIKSAPHLFCTIDKILWLLENNKPGTCDETIQGVSAYALRLARGESEPIK